MNKIINYTIITSYDADAVTEKVFALIIKGWQPYGSLSTVNKTNHLPLLAQAMVVYENEKIL
jgi:hypothetical protein